MLLILSDTQATQGALETLRLIKKHLVKKNLSHEIQSFDDVTIECENGSTKLLVKGNMLTSYSHIHFRKIGRMSEVALVLSSFAQAASILVIDTYHTKNKVSTAKIFQCYALSQSKISIPKTFFSGKYTKTHLLTASRKLGFPIIIKEFNSSQSRQGRGVHIAHSLKELEKITLEISKKDTLCLLQEYIPNDFDYRVLVLGGKAQVIEKKTRTKDTFRNNVALGATEEFLAISTAPKDIITLAEQAVKPLFLDVAGVDIVVHKETFEPYVLEVNKTPQFTLDPSLSNELEAFTNFLCTWAR